MTWFGWVYHRGRWHRVCTAEGMRQAAEELHRLRPGAYSTHRALTSGAAPDWTPGAYLEHHRRRATS